MKKLIFKISNSEHQDNSKQLQTIEYMEFITDRSADWVESQYLRYRNNTTMELISNETTEETESISRKI